MSFIKHSLSVLCFITSIAFSKEASTTWKKQAASLQDTANIGFFFYKENLLLYRSSLIETDLYRINITTGQYDWVSNEQPFHASRSVFWVNDGKLWCLGHSLGRPNLCLWSSLDGQRWEETKEIQVPLERKKEIPNRCFMRDGQLWVFFDSAIMKNINKEYTSWQTILDEFPWEKGYFLPYQTKDYMWSFGMSSRSVSMSVWYSEDGVNWIRPSYLFTLPMLWGFSLETSSEGGFFVYGGKYLLASTQKDSVYVRNPMSSSPVWRESKIPWSNLFGVRTFRQGETVVAGGGKDIYSGVDNNRIWIQNADRWVECFSDSPVDVEWLDVIWDEEKRQFWILAYEDKTQMVILYSHSGKKIHRVGNIANIAKKSSLLVVNKKLCVISTTADKKSLKGDIFIQELVISDQSSLIGIASKKKSLGNHILEKMQWVSVEGEYFFSSIFSKGKLDIWKLSSLGEVVKVVTMPFILHPQTKFYSYKGFLWLASEKLYRSTDGKNWEEVLSDGYQFISNSKIFTYKDLLVFFTGGKALATKDGIFWKEISIETSKNDNFLYISNMIGDDLIGFCLEDFAGERSFHRWEGFSKKLDIDPQKEDAVKDKN